MAQSALYQRYAAYYQRASALYARPQIRASLEIILSVFTVTLLIFFAIRPTLTNVVSLQKKIEDQAIVLKKADVKLAQLIKGESKLAENRDKVNLFLETIPEEIGYFNISKRIEILARENQVFLEVVRLPGSVVSGESIVPELVGERAEGMARPNKDGLSTIRVSFSVQGGQDQVMGFLRGLENMDILATIQEIRVSKVQAGSIAGLNLEGSAMFYTIQNDKK